MELQFGRIRIGATAARPRHYTREFVCSQCGEV